MPKILEPRPKRPYKSFDHYMAHVRLRAVGDWIQYPCTRCDGRGRVIAPGEHPDIIEGYKMSRRITCPLCEGTRGVDRGTRLEMYRAIMVAWAGRLTDWRVLDKARRVALRKLTRADRKALNLG